MNNVKHSSHTQATILLITMACTAAGTLYTVLFVPETLATLDRPAFEASLSDMVPTKALRVLVQGRGLRWLTATLCFHAFASAVIGAAATNYAQNTYGLSTQQLSILTLINSGSSLGMQVRSRLCVRVRGVLRGPLTHHSYSRRCFLPSSF